MFYCSISFEKETLGVHGKLNKSVVQGAIEHELGFNHA